MKAGKKIKDLLYEVRKAVLQDEYIYSVHAQFRMEDREVSRQEVLFVLLNGVHEKSKDVFDFQVKRWKYAICGKTVESRGLRIVVTFAEDGLLIITVIQIGKKQ